MVGQKDFEVPSNDSFGGLTARRLSRRQVITGLGAGALAATLPLDFWHSNLAYAQTGPQPTYTFGNVTNQLWQTRFEQAFGGIGPGAGPKQIRELVSLAYITQLIKQQSVRRPLDPNQILAFYQDFQRRYDDYTAGKTAWSTGARTDMEWDLFGLKALSTIMGMIPNPNAKLVGPSLGIVSELYIKLHQQPTLKMLTNSEQFVGAQRTYQVALATIPIKAAIISEAQDLARADSAAADGIDLIYFSSVHQKINIDPPKFGDWKPDLVQHIDELPDSLVPNEVRTTLKSAVENATPAQDGETLEMSPETLERLRAAFEQEIHNANTDLMNKEVAWLKGMDELQQDFNEWKSAEEAQQKKQEERQAAEQTYQVAMQGVQASVYLLSSFAKFADPKVAQEISVFGNASIQVIDSVKKFADSATQLTGLGLGVGAAVMTGNIAGAVMSVFSLFQGEKTPEDMILEQIGVLQKQVDTLHIEMSERFDRIEAGLNQVYSEMKQQFDKIDVQFGIIRGDLHSIEFALSMIESKMASMGRHIEQTIKAGLLQDLFTNINEAIGHKKTTGEDMPYLNPDGSAGVGTWVYYANLFYTWAVQHSRNDAWQDVSERSYAAEDLLEELNRPLEGNISYMGNLLNYLKEHEGWDINTFGTDLANPEIWAISSRAFAELRREWPEYAKRYKASNNTAVKLAGSQLQTAVRGITVEAQKSGENPVPNKKLIPKLVANYKEKSLESTGLNAKLAAVENDHLTDFQKDKSQKLDIDFWAGPYQSIDYVPPLPSVAVETRDGYTVPMNEPPPSTIAALIPAPYLLAEYMGLNSPARLNLSYSVWVTNFACSVCQEGPFPESPRFIKMSGDPSIRVTVNYGDTPILTRFVEGTRVETPCFHAGDTSQPFPSSRVPECSNPSILEIKPWSEGAWNPGWTSEQNLREKFDHGGSRELTPTPEEQAKREQLLRQVATQVGSELRNHQVKIYERINPALESPGNELNKAARILGGAKALLRDSIRLGMPHAYEKNDFVRALLSGSQSLVDQEQIRERYEAVTPTHDAALDLPVNGYVSLRSFNRPSQFVRHKDFFGELTEIQSELDEQDAMFKIVPGLEGANRREGPNTISFASLNFPSYYLTQQESYRLKLLPFSDINAKDASFFAEPGLAGANDTVSFRSYATSDHYLLHDEASEIWVLPSSSDNENRDAATFQLVIKNPRDYITQDTKQRAMNLDELLNGYLEKIGKGEHAESQSLVETAMLRLKIVDDIVENADTGHNAKLVEVPDVVSLSQDEAKTRLEGANLKLGSKQYTASSKVAKGRVMEQTPAAKTEVQRGSTVDITVSTGSGDCLTALATPFVVTTAMLVARKVLLKRLG